ncbi:MAG: hypothetical protein AAFR04_06265 [Pseudomonadota bacterium]
MSQSGSFLAYIIAVLWVIWGLVHALAGVLVLSGTTEAGFQAIADAVPADQLTGPYHAAVGGVLSQHAWNLLWFGVVTVIGAVFIARRSPTALWVTAMVGGLADLGYFMFVDLGGFANFLPGTLMTLVSGAAILLSAFAWFNHAAAAKPATPT